MSGVAIAFPVFSLMIFLALVVPIMMGVYVYRDAKRRGMNAPLWTLVSLLAPGFVGLIIYLIIRSEHSDLHCRSCSNPVKPGFSVCPYCGTALKDHCPNCGFTLEAGWIKCPGCGSEIPEDIRRNSQSSTKKDKGLKGLLLAILIIPVALCLVMFLAMCSLGAFIGRSSSASSIGMSSIEELGIPDANAEQLSQWVAECDAAGPGAYVLKAEDNCYYETGEYITGLLLYCNNGHYIEYADTSMGGWFTDATTEFNCNSGEGEDLPVLMYYEYISDEPCNPKVLLDGRKTDVIVKDVDWSYFLGLSSYYFNNICVEVAVDKSAEQISIVSCDFYSAGEVVMNETATPADGNSAAGESFYFTCPIDEYDNIDYAVLTAYSMEEEPLFATDLHLDEYPSWIVKIMTDENGEFITKIHEAF